MPDITIDFAPWLPGTNVNAYERKSELILPDQPPPETTLMATAVVDSDQSLTFSGLPVGDYWAIAPIDGVYRYVQLVAQDVDNLAIRTEALEAQVAALEATVAPLPAADVALDARLDVIEPALTAAQVALLDGQVGVLAPNGRGWASADNILQSQRTHWMRFVVPTPMVATKLGFYVGTAGSDVPCEVGLYGGAGFAKLATSGAVNGLLGSTGRKTAAIPATQLNPGVVYYAAFVENGLTASRLVGVGNSEMQSIFNTGFPTGQAAVLTANGVWPLPADMGSAGANVGAGFVGVVMVVSP